MTQSAESHLTRLADAAGGGLLAEMGFDWTPLDANVCAVMRFKRQVGDAPAIVGLAGGASSGKSTLFNSLLGREVSRISAHAHETLGPVAAVPASWSEQFESWNDRRLVFPGLETINVPPDEPSTGRVGVVAVCPHSVAALANVILVDLPDVTSKMSADEGSTARTLLPWFDGLLIVVDEERWFDAAVFDQTGEFARNFGPRPWVVFNRTERSEPLSPPQRQHLSDHAMRRHAADSWVSAFQPGSGYRPVSPETRSRLAAWLGTVDPAGRSADLEQYLQHRCAALVRTNVARAQQFRRLCRAVDRELDALTAETSLSTDLLTGDERVLLGLGRRFVPLYDTVQSARRWLTRFSRRGDPGRQVDFEKRADTLAEVLKRNLEHRFGHATDRIDRIAADSLYTDGLENGWTPTWTLPQLDAHEWAARIRAHIDAWKQESDKQTRRSDAAALSLGMPLLLADLLFLGGAGLTLTWAAAWVAGFLGGKSLATLMQRSPAFREYQTTVRAYQTLVREALAEQWEANLAAMPRRHLPMTDPLLESVMYWSTPKTR